LATAARSTGTGTWTLTLSTTGWASCTYTLFAQAEDSYGAFGDPTALTLTVPQMGTHLRLLTRKGFASML
jgi:hypothetical protein